MTNDKQKDESGFFDLPGNKCTHPGHEPPTHLHIPQGKGYKHVCPGCGNTKVLVAPQVSFEDKTTWLKCPHGHELRSLVRCQRCQEEKSNLLQGAIKAAQQDTRVPIYRGCNSGGSCFCSGACREIIGYREQ